jgi:hypothetical protein
VNNTEEKVIGTADLDRWVDLSSADFKRVEKHTLILKVLRIGIEAGLVSVDNAGYMWKKGLPVYAELDGKLVGLRYSARAVN